MIYFKSNCDELLQDGSLDFTDILDFEIAAGSLVHYVPVFVPSVASAPVSSGDNHSGFGGVIFERSAIKTVEFVIAFSIIAGDIDSLHCCMLFQCKPT